MQPELALKAISYTVIGILLVTLLIVLLISVRKELSGMGRLGCVSIRFGHHWFMHGNCPHGRVFSGAEDGLPHSNAQRLDTGTVSQPAGATT